MPAPSSPPLSRLAIQAALVVLIAALYIAREVFIPIALSILLAFMLAPLMLRLQRYGLPRVPAAVISVALICGLLIGTAFVSTGQLVQFASSLPSYRENIEDKLKAFRGGENGPLRQVERAGEALQDIADNFAREPEIDGNGELEIAEEEEPESPLSAIFEDKPIPVQLPEPEQNSWTMLREAIPSVAGPLGTASIVLIFTTFMLIYRDDVRDRAIRLVGEGQVSITTQAFDEAAKRVGRYLLTQAAVNGGVGLVVGIGLFLIGIPNAPLWGLLSALLRFVPFLGPWIAASMPIAVSLAISEGWTQPIATMAFFVLVELVCNNVVEPYAFSSGTGVSPLAVLGAAVFWTWMWGAIGLVLATPLTVCLVVIGQFVPQLHFFSVLFGSQPALNPGVRLYQRLLALDGDDASEFAERYCEANSRLELLDVMLIPALSMAEHDRNRGDLDDTRRSYLFANLNEIVDDTYEDVPGPLRSEEHEATPETQETGRPEVFCLPARDEADELAGYMLTRALGAADVRTRMLSVNALASEMVAEIVARQPRVVCISVVAPLAISHARYLCKRLKQTLPKTKVVVGLWGTRGDVTRASKRLTDAGAERVVITFAEAVTYLKPLSQPLVATPKTATDPPQQADAKSSDTASQVAATIK